MSCIVDNFSVKLKAKHNGIAKALTPVSRQTRRNKCYHNKLAFTIGTVYQSCRELSSLFGDYFFVLKYRKRRNILWQTLLH